MRMKRLVSAVLVAAMMLAGFAVFAEEIDLSTLDDEVLSRLFTQVQQEMEKRAGTEGADNPEEEILFSKGAKGKEVTALQEKLIDLGYLSGKADGSYGNKTINAIKALQKAFGIKEDGNVTQSLLDLIDTEIAKMPEKPKSFTAVELYKKFKNNQIAAEDELNGHTVTVSGKVYSVDSSLWGEYYVRLYADSWGLSSVYCYFDDSMKSELAGLSKGKKATIQGIVNGASVLGDPTLKECKIIG